MEHLQNVIAVILILGTPCLAIAGGIVASILKMRAQHRLMELAMRERIVALEKGLDPGPIATPAAFGVIPPAEVARRRAQGLMIGGLLTIALGAGLMLTLPLLPPGDGRENWPTGIIPILLGVALLISSRLIRKTIA
jgi:hypothetical protein